MNWIKVFETLFDDSEKILKEENAAKKQKLELEASQAEELR